MLSALMTTAFLTAAAPSPESESRETAALRPVVRAVVACVLREPPDHADVEDCTHEAIRRAMERPDERRGPLRPWLLGIARHVALDALRARKRDRARAVPVPADEPSGTSLVIDRLVDPGQDPLEKVEQSERDRQVRRVLDALPEGPRKALELFHIEGLEYKEIAARLDVPLGTVATWVTRGRKAMASTLEETRGLP